MTRKITLEEAMDIQEMLNVTINENWVTERSMEEFDVAIHDELSEYLGSGRRWKWWKSAGSPNTWNEKLEIIDAIHFYLSKMIISLRKGDEKVKDSLVMSIGTGATQDIGVAKPDGSLNHMLFMYAVRLFMSHKPSLEDLNHILSLFGISGEEFAAIYKAKASLNHIRQHGGYKTGRYKKTVDGVEDNDRLRAIVDAYLDDPGMDLTDIEKAVTAEFFQVTDK